MKTQTARTTTRPNAKTTARTKGGRAQDSRYRRIAATAAALCIGSLLMAGCGGKEESAPPAGAAQSSGASGGTVTATPPQEAAKQRSIDEGAAIQAANDPTKNNPATGGTGK